MFSISAEHGLGISELMDEVVQQFPNAEENEARPEADKAPLRVSVVGRPNVGKSTLINRLLGFERSVVDSVPGTTRDALDTPFELQGEPCILVDTAGIRRKARIYDRLERFSVSHSLRSVDRGDLVIHILDGVEGVTDQDAQILSYACQRGKALLLVVNKWDVVSQERRGGGDLQGRGLSPAFVFGFCSRDFYFRLDGLRRAQDVRDGGRRAAGLRQESFDLRYEPGIAADRQSSRGAPVAGQAGEILLWDTDRNASTDFYFVRQYAAGSSGELPALLDSSAARTLGT